MKRPTAPNLYACASASSSWTRPASIDLYGLEPIWEPAAGVPPLALEEFVAVACPYCGERLETRVDLTADEPAYVEDCEVCCRPIEFQHRA